MNNKIEIGRFAKIIAKADNAGKIVQVTGIVPDGPEDTYNPLYQTMDDDGFDEQFFGEELEVVHFYQIFNQDGPYHTGTNATSLEEAKNDVLDLICMDSETEDIEEAKALTPEQFLANYGLQFEMSATPFEE